MPTDKSGPSYAKWTLAGGLLGGILVCAIILIKYLMDDTIKTSEDIERYLGISTLGSIPIIESIVEDSKKSKRK